MKSLWDRVDFAFQKNDHTAAELLLYPQGFQQYTPTPDNGIFTALAGNDVDSGDRRQGVQRGRRGLGDPGQPARRGHVGEPLRSRPRRPSSTSRTATRSTTATTRTASSASRPRAPSRSTRTSPASSSRTTRRTMQAEFERHLLFALDLAESAADPANPVSHLGNARAATSTSTTFADSYGDPQTGRGDGQALARRRAAALPHQRRQRPDGADRGGPGRRAVQQRPGRLLPPPPRSGEGHRAAATASRSGSRAAGSTPRTSPTTAVSESGAQGADPGGRELHGPAPGAGPERAALPDVLHGRARSSWASTYDIYDVDARGNRSPDSPRRARPLRRGDLVHGRRLPDPPAGPAGRAPAPRASASRSMIDVRDFLNEGGKLLLHGQGRRHAVRQTAATSSATSGSRSRVTPRTASTATRTARTWTRRRRRSIRGPSSTRTTRTMADGCITHNDDFLQYYLGAYVRASPGNSFDDDAGEPFDAGRHRRRAVRGLRSAASTRRGAGNQDNSATFVVTSSILPTGPRSRCTRRRARRPLAAARRGAVRPVQRHAVHGRGRGQPRLQAADARRSTSRRDGHRAVVQDLGRRRGGLGLRGGRGCTTSPRTTWTTLPDVSGKG